MWVRIPLSTPKKKTVSCVLLGMTLHICIHCNQSWFSDAGHTCGVETTASVRKSTVIEQEVDCSPYPHLEIVSINEHRNIERVLNRDGSIAILEPLDTESFMTLKFKGGTPFTVSIKNDDFKKIVIPQIGNISYGKHA